MFFVKKLRCTSDTVFAVLLTFYIFVAPIRESVWAALGFRRLVVEGVRKWMAGCGETKMKIVVLVIFYFFEQGTLLGVFGLHLGMLRKGLEDSRFLRLQKSHAPVARRSGNLGVWP